MDYTTITLGELLSSSNDIIRRNATSILKQLQKAPKKYPIGEPGFIEHYAIKTSEYRAPKKGEWYISGAPPEAYMAPNNLTQKFYIAKLEKKQHAFTR